MVRAQLLPVIHLPTHELHLFLSPPPGLPIHKIFAVLLLFTSPLSHYSLRLIMVLSNREFQMMKWVTKCNEKGHLFSQSRIMGSKFRTMKLWQKLNRKLPCLLPNEILFTYDSNILNTQHSNEPGSELVWSIWVSETCSFASWRLVSRITFMSCRFSSAIFYYQGKWSTIVEMHANCDEVKANMYQYSGHTLLRKKEGKGNLLIWTRVCALLTNCPILRGLTWVYFWG